MKEAAPPKKIIVRMPNWIGDLVMATPILSDLRKKFPEAEITVMCQKPLSELLQEDPDINEIFAFEKLPCAFLRKVERRDVISRIREGKYDLGLLLTNSFSSAWWFYRGQVENRVGFSGHFRSLLLNNTPDLPKDIHQVEAYKHLLKPLGIPVSTTLPRIFLKDEEVKEAKELLEQRGASKHKVIGISPGAAFGPSKRWPEENFFALVEKLSKDPSLRIVIVGDSSVTPFAKKIVRAFDSVIDLTGTTSLRMLCSIISLCDLFLTNDSGPMHIAAALKVPLIALFGSTSPQKTGPYKHGEILYKNVSCSPCFKRVCPIDFPCMKKITVKEVYQKVCSALNQKKN